jgi:hypothetical protein
MTNQIIINQTTIDSMKNIVDMYIDQERTHLEESLDDDLSHMTDEQMYEMLQHNTNHIWLDLYNISLLTK